jgi:3-hydroxymyristoyl/3-hydroxydecanoyl-(acyl carrier protein) dehydratase
MLPTIKAVEQDNDKVILSLFINVDLRCFKGHFDDASIVPGVVQLDWAMTFARKHLAMHGDVLNVSVLKFQNLLLPAMEVRLEIIKKSATKLTFSYYMDDDKFSSARVELA